MEHLAVILKGEGYTDIVLGNLYIGGCSLDTHWSNINSGSVAYTFYTNTGSGWSSRSSNIQTGIDYADWDVITIQQGSVYSWDYATYQPYADTVIAYIRKFNPQAKIMIQQTWAYRSDDPRLLPGENSWGFDRDEMHERVRSAYHKFAADTGFELIPTGETIALYRTKLPQYKVLSSEELAGYKNPDLPPMANDIVGKHWWVKHNGEMKLMRDCIHLNFRGEYLQACVWYIALFGESTASIHYEHPKISSEECQAMAAAAENAFMP